MRIRRMWRLLAGSVVVVGLVGCAGPAHQGGAEPESGSDPVQESVPPSASQQVAVVFSTPHGGEGVRGLDYEVSVAFGEPLEGGAGCDLATPQGTVTVPVAVTVAQNHETTVAGLEGVQGPEGEPVTVGSPRSFRAQVVGEVGPLRWEPKRPGYPCTDQIDLAAHTSRLEPGEQVVLTGYLAGVPETDRAGTGVTVELARDSWVIHQGAPEPLTVTY